MGKLERLKKAQQAQRIKLKRADFFELSAAFKDLAFARQMALERARANVEGLINDFIDRDTGKVAAKARALMIGLGKRYRFDPNPIYLLNDATCELIPQAPPVATPPPAPAGDPT